MTAIVRSRYAAYQIKHLGLTATYVNANRLNVWQVACFSVRLPPDHLAKVHLADTEVAASWDDVMSPPPAPAVAKRPKVAPAALYPPTPFTGLSENTIKACGDACPSILGGDDLPKSDADDPTATIQKGECKPVVGVGGGTNCNESLFGSNSSSANVGAGGSGVSTHSGISGHSAGSPSLVEPPRSSQGEVAGSTPLEVKPGLAAQKFLRALRMHVTRLRITKDNETKAEE